MENLHDISWKRHLATTVDFDTLYTNIMERVEKGLIYRQVNNKGLELFKYSLNCHYDKMWDEYTLMARGLILDPKNKKIVALGISKFFNLGENSYSIPNSSFNITQKYDGSCIIAFWNDNQWNTATLGSFDSEQSQWAKKWLLANVNTELMNKDATYIFEAIYKENRIVISYNFEGLVLITAFNLETGFEWEYPAIVYEGKQLGIKVVDQHNYNTIDEMLEVCKTLDHNQEGFVVQFLNGYRIKIKGDEYVRVHRIISNVTPLRVWDMILNGDNLEEIEKQLPEELRKDFCSIKKILEDKIEATLKNVESFYQSTKHLTDKEIGLMLAVKNDILPVQASLVFSCRKKNFLVEWKILGSKMRKALFKHIKPQSNKLEGFVPSSNLNRFSDLE
jgi:RNA ligase